MPLLSVEFCDERQGRIRLLYKLFSCQCAGQKLSPPRNLCGAERVRTDDLRLAKPALSQLSYSPSRSRSQRAPPSSPLALNPRSCRDLVGQGRLELPTLRLSGVRSNHLSYWPSASATGLASRFPSGRGQLGPSKLSSTIRMCPGLTQGHPSGASLERR